MDDVKRPRHIRDIAHLYLSRLGATDGVTPKQVYVAATSRECFGGYHAANIALCFAQNGYSVQLIEVSGMLPCSAYFLGLPSRVYLRHKSHSPDESLSALGGVTIRFSEPREPDATDTAAAGVTTGLKRRSAGAVDVYHLPPMDEVDALQDVLERAGRISGAEKRAVVLAPSESAAIEAGKRVFGPRVTWAALSLLERRYNSQGVSTGGRSLGYLVGWRPLLADALPCVLRDPDSHVSRSYSSVCDALLAPISAVGRRYERKTHGRTATPGRIR